MTPASTGPSPRGQQEHCVEKLNCHYRTLGKPQETAAPVHHKYGAALAYLELQDSHYHAMTTPGTSRLSQGMLQWRCAQDERVALVKTNPGATEPHLPMTGSTKHKVNCQHHNQANPRPVTARGSKYGTHACDLGHRYRSPDGIAAGTTTL